MAKDRNRKFSTAELLGTAAKEVGRAVSRKIGRGSGMAASAGRTLKGRGRKLGADIRRMTEGQTTDSNNR